MSLPIYVDAYSGYRSNERPLRFHLDEATYEITVIEDRWNDPKAEYFKVRTADNKRFLLRCAREEQTWTPESGFDSKELFLRPGIESVPVLANTIQEAISRISGCEDCRGDDSEQPLESLGK